MNRYVVASALTTLFMSLGLSALAGDKPCQPFEIQAQNLPALLKKIQQRPDVNTPIAEQIAKRNLINLHERNPKEFFKRFNQGTNGDQYQSYLEEVQTALTESGKLFGEMKSLPNDFMKNSNVAHAKDLARYILFVTASDNWDQVGKTIVNDGASESLEEFQKALSIKLRNNLILAQRKNRANRDTYLFLLPENDNVRVTLRKTEINKGEVCLRGVSKREDNQLIPEASKIFMDPAAVAAAKAKRSESGSKIDTYPEPSISTPPSMQSNSGAPAKPAIPSVPSNGYQPPTQPYGNGQSPQGGQQPPPFHDPFDDFDPDF